jgi:hypothetical protein
MRDDSHDSADGDEDGVEALAIDSDADSEKSSVISDDDDDDGDLEDARQEDLESQPLSGASARSVRRKCPSARLVTAQAPADTPVPKPCKDATAVSWRDLPRKDQLIVLTLARLSEPLVQTSLQVPAVAACPPRSFKSLMLLLLVVHVLHAEMVQSRLPRLRHLQPGRRSAVIPSTFTPRDHAARPDNETVVARASLLHSF